MGPRLRSIYPNSASALPSFVKVVKLLQEIQESVLKKRVTFSQFALLNAQVIASTVDLELSTEEFEIIDKMMYDTVVASASLEQDIPDEYETFVGDLLSEDETDSELLDEPVQEIFDETGDLEYFNEVGSLPRETTEEEYVQLKQEVDTFRLPYKPGQIEKIELYDSETIKRKFHEEKELQYDQHVDELFVEKSNFDRIPVNPVEVDIITSKLSVPEESKNSKEFTTKKPKLLRKSPKGEKFIMKINDELETKSQPPWEDYSKILTDLENEPLITSSKEEEYLLYLKMKEKLQKVRLPERPGKTKMKKTRKSLRKRVKRFTQTLENPNKGKVRKLLTASPLCKDREAFIANAYAFSWDLLL